MQKVDLLITGILVSVMLYCFYLGSQWSYFGAGICATCTVFVNLGSLAYQSATKRQKEEWQHFVSNMDEEVDVKSLLHAN
jgi:hypothetical protein